MRLAISSGFSIYPMFSAFSFCLMLIQSLLHCCLFPPRYFHSLELSAEDDEEEDLDWLILAVGELLFLLPEDSIASEFERRIDGLVIDF